MKFTLGRPKAALQKVQQRNRVEECPAEEAEQQVLQDLAVTKTTTATTSIATSQSNKAEVGAGLPPKTPPTTTTVAVAAPSRAREAACNSPTPRARPASRGGEYREYGPGEYNAMITRRARSFEGETGAGYRGGSSGLRKRDASWDRKWRDEQDRNRSLSNVHVHNVATQVTDHCAAFFADLVTSLASAAAGFLAKSTPTRPRIWSRRKGRLARR